ncbi:hypothetical protein ACFSC4_05380 [Deinococcus malanensis]|uniref:hypothetical protein n=1 Tax=Deinococcus malanensis TaxID=1706855 RepID=UPI003629F6A8
MTFALLGSLFLVGLLLAVRVPERVLAAVIAVLAVTAAVALILAAATGQGDLREFRRV